MFDWNNILHLARSGSHTLFERQWRTQPIRTLARTMWLSVARPFRLWSSYDVHDPPQLIPLVLMILVQFAMFYWGWDVIAVGATWFMDNLARWNDSNQTFVYNLRLSNNDMVFLAYWYFATFLSFQVFILSKRRFRVRWQQTLRVFVHATCPLACATMAWCMVEMCMDIGLLVKPGLRWSGSDYYMAGRIVLFSLAALSCFYVWVGYARYLEMPRGWGVAILGLVLGHCAARWMMIMWH